MTTRLTAFLFRVWGLGAFLFLFLSTVLRKYPTTISGIFINNIGNYIAINNLVENHRFPKLLQVTRDIQNRNLVIPLH